MMVNVVLRFKTCNGTRMKITALTFTPSEAATITGVNTQTQRNFRRFGYMEKGNGHSRFDVYDLSKLLFVQKRSEVGVGPKKTFPIASIASAGIAAGAMGLLSAYQGNHFSLNERGAILPPNLDRFITQSELLSILTTSERLEYQEDIGKNPNNLALKYGLVKLLQKKSARQYGGWPVQKYLINWADGSSTCCGDIQGVINDLQFDDPKRSGQSIFMDLEILGRELVEKAPRPFFDVKIIWD